MDCYKYNRDKYEDCNGCICNNKYSSKQKVSKACSPEECKYFIVSTPEIKGGQTAIIFLDNPKDNYTNMNVNMISTTNYSCGYIVTYIIDDINPSNYKTYNLDIKSSNLGCSINTNINAYYTVLSSYIEKDCLDTLTQNIQEPFTTVNIVGSNSRFVVPPGNILAIMIASSKESINVGIDIRWKVTLM